MKPNERLDEGRRAAGAPGRVSERPDLRPWFGAAPREWLAVLCFPVAGAIIVAWLVHVVLRSDSPRTEQWLALALGLACGFVAGFAYTLRLALEGRLFLRDAAAIARNRSRTTTVGVPLGIMIAVVGALLSGALEVAFLAALAGAGLGLEPGVAANFLRLRREEWLPARRSGLPGR